MATYGCFGRSRYNRSEGMRHPRVQFGRWHILDANDKPICGATGKGWLSKAESDGPPLYNDNVCRNCQKEGSVK